MGRKIVVYRVRKGLSLRTSPLSWCGNPPTIQDGLLGRLSVFRTFRNIRGIATPVCALARNDSVFGVRKRKQQFIAFNDRTAIDLNCQFSIVNCQFSQWWNSRMPVKAMATPCLLHSSMTRSSRMEPPGWAMYRTPEATARWILSAKGKKASEPRATS